MRAGDIDVGRARRSGLHSTGRGLALSTLIALGAPWSAADDDVRARIRAMPSEQLDRLHALRTRQAEEAIEPTRRRELSTRGCVLVTDARGSRLPERLAEHVEATQGALRQLLGGELTDDRGPALRIYAYASGEDYRSLVRRWVGMEWAGGFYDPAGMIAIDLEQGGDDHVASTLAHELTHAWLDRHLAVVGRSLPLWLNEGLSEYVANSDVVKGRLVLGAHRQLQTRFVMRREGVLRLASPHAVDARTIKNANRLGLTPSLAELLTATPLDFYGERRHLFYSQSWMLVHFLRHGSTPDALGSLLGDLARGVPGPSALRRATDVPLDRLAEQLDEYVRRF